MDDREKELNELLKKWLADAQNESKPNPENEAEAIASDAPQQDWTDQADDPWAGIGDAYWPGAEDEQGTDTGFETAPDDFLNETSAFPIYEPGVSTGQENDTWGYSASQPPDSGEGESSVYPTYQPATFPENNPPSTGWEDLYSISPEDKQAEPMASAADESPRDSISTPSGEPDAPLHPHAPAPHISRFALGMIFLAGAVLLLAGGSLVVGLAQTSQPDQGLYRIKLISEDARIALSYNRAYKSTFALDFSSRRSSELLALLRSRRVPVQVLVSDYEFHINQAIRYALALPDDQAALLLQQIDASLRSQLLEFMRVSPGDDPQMAAVLAQIREMLLAHLQWVQVGIEQPGFLRDWINTHSLRNQPITDGPGAQAPTLNVLDLLAATSTPQPTVCQSCTAAANEAGQLTSTAAVGSSTSTNTPASTRKALPTQTATAQPPAGAGPQPSSTASPAPGNPPKPSATAKATAQPSPTAAKATQAPTLQPSTATAPPPTQAPATATPVPPRPTREPKPSNTPKK